MMDDLHTYEPELIAMSRVKLPQQTKFTSWYAFMLAHPEFEQFMSKYELVRLSEIHSFYLRVGDEPEVK